MTVIVVQVDRHDEFLRHKSLDRVIQRPADRAAVVCAARLAVHQILMDRRVSQRNAVDRIPQRRYARLRIVPAEPPHVVRRLCARIAREFVVRHKRHPCRVQRRLLVARLARNVLRHTARRAAVLLARSIQSVQQDKHVRVIRRDRHQCVDRIQQRIRKRPFRVVVLRCLAARQCVIRLICRARIRVQRRARARPRRRSALRRQYVAAHAVDRVLLHYAPALSLIRIVPVQDCHQRVHRVCREVLRQRVVTDRHRARVAACRDIPQLTAPRRRHVRLPLHAQLVEARRLHRKSVIRCRQLRHRHVIPVQARHFQLHYRRLCARRTAVDHAVQSAVRLYHCRIRLLIQQRIQPRYAFLRILRAALLCAEIIRTARLVRRKHCLAQRHQRVERMLSVRLARRQLALDRSELRQHAFCRRVRRGIDLVQRHTAARTAVRHLRVLHRRIVRASCQNVRNRILCVRIHRLQLKAAQERTIMQRCRVRVQRLLALIQTCAVRCAAVCYCRQRRRIRLVAGQHVVQACRCEVARAAARQIRCADCCARSDLADLSVRAVCPACIHTRRCTARVLSGPVNREPVRCVRLRRTGVRRSRRQIGALCTAVLIDCIRRACRQLDLCRRARVEGVMFLRRVAPRHVRSLERIRLRFQFVVVRAPEHLHLDCVRRLVLTARRVQHGLRGRNMVFQIVCRHRFRRSILIGKCLRTAAAVHKVPCHRIPRQVVVGCVLR